MSNSISEFSHLISDNPVSGENSYYEKNKSQSTAGLKMVKGKISECKQMSMSEKTLNH
jgi:hypothetical protein